MNITTPQVAEMLGTGTSVVRRLARNGKLTPVNTQRNGTKKFFMQFDQKAVREFIKTEWKPSSNGHGGRRVKTTAPEGPSIPYSFIRHLDAIEAKLDRLIGLWS